MSSKTRDREGLIGATEIGDRSIAGLLSALAEAPDFASAASFLLAQVLELSALVPADPFDGVREAGLAEARSKVVEVGVGNRDPERSELERHPVFSLVSRERGGPRSSRDNAATPVNPAQSARRLRRLRGACARMPTQGTKRSSPRH